MKTYVYSELLGLNEIEIEMATGQWPSYAPGTIIYGQFDARFPMGWYQRVVVRVANSRTQHRGLDWAPIKPENLPKKLKAWALVMGITL